MSVYMIKLEWNLFSTPFTKLAPFTLPTSFFKKSFFSRTIFFELLKWNFWFCALSSKTVM